MDAYKTIADVTPATALAIPTDGTNSPVYVTKRLDVGPLMRGDVVDLRFREEVTDDDDALGAWTVGGVQSEHWSLWVMVAWQVDRVEPPTVAGGAPVRRHVRRSTATNIDRYIHHTTVEGTELDIVDRDLETASYELGLYFAASKIYVKPGATIRVEPGYGKLEAIVWPAGA